MVHQQLQDAESRHTCLIFLFKLRKTARQAHQHMCRMICSVGDEDLDDMDEAFVDMGEEEGLEDSIPFETIVKLFLRFERGNFEFKKKFKYSNKVKKGENYKISHSLALLLLKNRPNQEKKYTLDLIDQVKVVVAPQVIKITMNGENGYIEMGYEEDSDGTWLSLNGRTEYLVGPNYLELAAIDFSLILNHLKCQLLSLEISSEGGNEEEPIFERFYEKVVDRVENPISIEKFHMEIQPFGEDSLENQLRFWKLLVKKELTTIVIRGNRLRNIKGFDAFLRRCEKTEQWIETVSIDMQDEALNGVSPAVGSVREIVLWSFDPYLVTSAASNSWKPTFANTIIKFRESLNLKEVEERMKAHNVAFFGENKYECFLMWYGVASMKCEKNEIQFEIVRNFY